MRAGNNRAERRYKSTYSANQNNLHVSQAVDEEEELSETLMKSK